MLFSAFRQGSGVPPWLVSEMTASMLIMQADKWLHLLPPLGFSQSVHFLQYDPYLEQISMEPVEKDSEKWAESNQVRDALLTLDRLLHSVDELWDGGKLAQGRIVLRTLPALGALFWCPEGRRIMPEVARILGCSEETPARVFDSYGAAIESGDVHALQEIHQLIDSDPVFSSWTEEFCDTATSVDLPERPSPLHFMNLVSSVLLRMLQGEERSDND